MLFLQIILGLYDTANIPVNRSQSYDKIIETSF
jgi:hypothetical protein